MAVSRYAPDTLGRGPSWATFAACKEPGIDPDVFFDDKDISAAVEICHGCPVREMCLADALAREGRTAPSSRFGILGGLGPDDRYRRATGRRTRNGRPPAECGTDGAYRRHIKNGEPVDDACRQAHNEYALAHYHQQKARVAA
jgi:hypothetical protein